MCSYRSPGATTVSLERAEIASPSGSWEREPLIAVSLERIKAVLLQELYITARSVEVIVDLPFWSVMTVVVFGFVTKFLATVMNPTIAG